MLGDAKKPYVRFETREKLNRTRSEDAGRQVYDDVDYVIVMVHGSKDEFVKEAQEWLHQKKREAGQGAYPPDWAEHFQEQYNHFKAGKEMPAEGTPLKMWPVVTPGEIKTFAAMMPPITTVEELAGIPDSGLQLLGMNGRVMRDKAKTWLLSAQDQGKVAEEVASLKELNRQQQESMEGLLARISELEAALPGKPGRPKNADRLAA